MPAIVTIMKKGMYVIYGFSAAPTNYRIKNNAFTGGTANVTPWVVFLMIGTIMEMMNNGY
jgi:hypothetical protein